MTQKKDIATLIGENFLIYNHYVKVGINSGDKS